jgi:hypothetical protein
MYQNLRGSKILNVFHKYITNFIQWSINFLWFHKGNLEHVVQPLFQLAYEDTHTFSI